mgnify:CR=1 FL=1
MLDPKKLRQSIDEIANNLARRGFKFDTKAYVNLNDNRKKLQIENEDLKSKRNSISRDIGMAKSKGDDTGDLMKSSEEINTALSENESQLNEILSKMREIELGLPNTLMKTVPDGKDETSNELIRSWGEKTVFDFEPKDHIELGNNLGLLDLDKASEISGSRFSVLNGKLATLQRALIQFMLDLHIDKHAYEEFYVPYIVNGQSLVGTSQLPKFESDLFKIDSDKSYYLIPTAEVPLTNLFGNKITDASTLPRKLVAHTPCFRSEAGSYGKDTKGIIRQHQFEKVELVHITKPDDAERSLDLITDHAEKIMESLEIPYQRVLLSTGDLGFSSSKTFDIEAWFPSQECYREISSCSLFSDFQSRRLNIKFINQLTKKKEFVSTLNGSGLAIGRTMAALIENHTDGKVIKIPKALQPFTGFEIIKL